MRLVTWNVNSLRSRFNRLVDVIERQQPDVLALQETKCSDALFAERFAPTIASLGYEAVHHGVDHWNGVAILSRVGIDNPRAGFPGRQRPPYDQARLLAATCGGIDVHSVYVPNGRALDDPHYLFKLVWLERLRSVIDPDQATVLAGDFNVAPTDADLYDPRRWRRKTHASEPERAAIDHLLDAGLIDLARSADGDEAPFTWWNYRPGQFDAGRGLRIDLMLASPSVAARMVSISVDRHARVDDPARNPGGEKPSDHAPLILDLGSP